MAEASAPLTEADLQDIKQRLADCDRLDAMLKTAREGGLDVAAKMEQSRELRQQLLKLKQAYFPNR